MYVKKLIIKKVIDLFTNKPQFRDDRWGTIKKIVEELRSENKDFSEWVIVQHAFDVDRSFRYVQQHIPSLRGNNWLQRQRNSGEISAEEYESKAENLYYIQKVIGEYYQGLLFEQ